MPDRSKLLRVLIPALVMLFLSWPVFAYESILVLNNQYMNCSNPVVIENGETFIPVGETFAKMGGSVSWDAMFHLVNINYNNKTIIMKADSTDVSIDGQLFQYKTPFRIKDGRAYMALSFVADYLGLMIRTENDSTGIRAFISNPTTVFKYISNKTWVSTASNISGEHYYFVSDKPALVDLYLDKDNLIKDILPFDNKEITSEKIKYYPDYNKLESFSFDGSQYILNMGFPDKDYVYKKYENRTTINNISTQGGIYSFAKYQNRMRQFYFDKSGKSTAVGTDDEIGYLLEKDGYFVFGKPLGHNDGVLQKYMFADKDMLLTLNHGGYKVEEKLLRYKLYKPLVLELESDEAQVVMGGIQSQGSSYCGLYFEFFGLKEADKKANWFAVDFPAGNTAEIKQAVLKDQKVIFLASSGKIRYLGYVDNSNNQSDYQALPEWAQDIRIINGGGNYYLMWRDGVKIYVSEIVF